MSAVTKSWSSSVWTRRKVCLPLPLFPRRTFCSSPYNSFFPSFLSFNYSLLISLLWPPAYIVSPVSGYIDLSKRRVSPDDITKCEERYMKSKTVASILRHVATKLPSYDPTASAADPSDPSAKSGETKSKRGPKGGAPPRANGAAAEGGEGGEGEAMEGVEPGSSEEERLEKLYEQIAWPLNKKYAHPYDAFKVALTYVFLLIFILCLASSGCFSTIVFSPSCDTPDLSHPTGNPTPSSPTFPPRSHPQPTSCSHKPSPAVSPLSPSNSGLISSSHATRPPG